MDDRRFKLTYSTMFNPPEALHSQFDEAVERAKAGLGREHPMWIAGKPRQTSRQFETRSPINRDWVIGQFQRGSTEDVNDAVSGARMAFPAWAATPWIERVGLLRRAASLIEQRVYDIAAAMALEVGKNRMECLGEVQETADLVSWYCDQMEVNEGFAKTLANDPLDGWISRNRTILKPHGAWVVIAPFNFPLALAGGPIGAALVTGNTVVFKVASDTSLCGWLLLEVFRDAGLPDGVVNFVSGGGSEVGETLVQHPAVGGLTFTGSYEVGMHIFRSFAQGPWPRPCIAEMGGKNATIVSRRADLERAATGIVRSAFGLQGQKCSACSRVYAERPIVADLLTSLVDLTGAIKVGDPCRKENWMGPVINASAYESYRLKIESIRQAGRTLTGGQQMLEGDLAKGYFCAPTVATVPYEHPLWNEEMFLPIVFVGEVNSLDEAMNRANACEYGLTAGFYGDRSELDWFFSRIEAGVTYANRPQGATTGAWPGYQPFGGWKGSGTTGKAIGSFWYLPQYLREQSQTVVD